MSAPHEHPSRPKPADVEADHWIERYLPASWQAYARLARLDRPIGTWLLFLPCLWGLILAKDPNALWPDLDVIFLFSVGALVMRGAGCTLNDIIDRDIDAAVARTAGRPIASGQISRFRALIFLGLQLAVGLAVLLQFNALTITLGIASLGLVGIYPFMKRITWWPQLFLGLAFNWGVLMAVASQSNDVSMAALWLYMGGVFWTLGYDTIYAHQDREDDALIGVKSSARYLGANTRAALQLFYVGLMVCLFGAALAQGLGVLFWFGLAMVGWHLWRQIMDLDIDDPEVCLMLFRRNRDTGLLIALSLLLGS